MPNFFHSLQHQKHKETSQRTVWEESFRTANNVEEVPLLVSLSVRMDLNTSRKFSKEMKTRKMQPNAALFKNSRYQYGIFRRTRIYSFFPSNPPKSHSKKFIIRFPKFFYKQSTSWQPKINNTQFWKYPLMTYQKRYARRSQLSLLVICQVQQHKNEQYLWHDYNTVLKGVLQKPAQMTFSFVTL